MKNESGKQAVAPEVAPLEKDYTFWVIVDEEEDIVSVEHPAWGELKAVFANKEQAEDALKTSTKGPYGENTWKVLPATITGEE